MPLKPIQLSAFGSNFVPPVTGVSGLAPFANLFDPSGHFRTCVGSTAKRGRSEEIDLVYDLSANYPPLTPPAKQNLNVHAIRELITVASAYGGEVKVLLDNENNDPFVKKLGEMNMALLAVVEAVMESGIVPLSTGIEATGRGFAAMARRVVNPPPPAPKPAPEGLKELKAGLEKADLKAVLYEANLGEVSIANRNGLGMALSVGFRTQALQKAADDRKDPVEAIRVIEDALSCVNDMEFLGTKSQPFINNRDLNDPRDKKYCTMPVKLKFDDRDFRINFERTVPTHFGLRAVMSLPQPIRAEQADFNKAIRERYPTKIVMIRLDVRNLSLNAFVKDDGNKSWTKCVEALALPPGILLPGYIAKSRIELPPVTVVSDDNIENMESSTN